MNEPSLPVVYFDTNDTVGADIYSLHLPTSLQDLEKIDGKHDGMRVLIRMTDELEAEAEITCTKGVWLARPVGPWRYLDGSD